MACRSSTVPIPPPIGQAPNPITGTAGPLLPRMRVSMRASVAGGDAEWSDEGGEAQLRLAQRVALSTDSLPLWKTRTHTRTRRGRWERNKGGTMRHVGSLAAALVAVLF